MQSTGQTSMHASQPVQLSARMTANSLGNFLRALPAPLAMGFLVPQAAEGVRGECSLSGTLVERFSSYRNKMGRKANLGHDRLTTAAEAPKGPVQGVRGVRPARPR